MSFKTLGRSSCPGEVAPAPSAVVSTGEAYGSLAFDAAGDLWITAARDGAELALRFGDPGHLTGAVAPQPVARVRLPSSTATFAAGMAFDGDGALWIATSAALLEAGARRPARRRREPPGRAGTCGVPRSRVEGHRARAVKAPSRRPYIL